MQWTKRLLMLAAYIWPLFLPGAACALTPLTPVEEGVKQALLAVIRQQDNALLRGDAARLRRVYVLPEATEALRHAMARRDFLHAWQATRRVRIDAVSVDLRTPGIKFTATGRVRVSAVVSEDFSYHHSGRPDAEARFGLGTRRWYVLRRVGSAWRIGSEEYTDPLDQDTRIPGEALPAQDPAISGGVASGTRVPAPAGMAAVTYADRFCGAAPGCGNQQRYNARYGDFNGEGGDCTNFISQTLRAGGFRPTASWYWDTAKHEGTRAWSNAEGLVAYLEATGRGEIVASGTYESLTRTSPRFPATPLALVGPGDIVAYRERGRVVHLAVVTGRDPSGYLLVNSHTSDRFHVPWDIGWDRSTRFHLVRLNYPVRAPERPA